MEACELGVVDALAAIEAGRITATDYLESCIARTLSVEPRLHAFAHFDLTAVRAQNHGDGRLAGMPIGVKDVIATKGVPTEMGSAAFLGHVPDRSASVIDMLSAASAVLFGKTVTTEFAWRNPGATVNPWNVDHTPGGSSSGSAAAVAAGCVPAALGTQTLGSVLRPAAFCGVVGYKPSFGAIPRTGVYAVADSLDHVGVFARHVADAALVAAVLTGRDGVDVPRLAPLVPAWPLRATVDAPRIALLRTSMDALLSPAQRDVVASVARDLASHGAVVVPLVLPAAFDAIWSTAQTICDVEGAVVNAALAAERPPRVGAPTIELVARGAATPAMDYFHARRLQDALTRAFAALVESFDAVLTAPAPGAAPKGLADTGDAVFCTPASLFGAPAITLPVAVDGGLPLGIQLLGAWGDDRRLLEAALWVERMIGRVVTFPML